MLLGDGGAFGFARGLEFDHYGWGGTGCRWVAVKGGQHNGHLGGSKKHPNGVSSYGTIRWRPISLPDAALRQVVEDLPAATESWSRWA